VCGEDHHGHFDLISSSKAELDDEAVTAHKRAIAAYRDNHLEYEMLHRHIM
jgi:hypothetical protein